MQTDRLYLSDIAVHAYFSVDWAIVWHTVTVEVPALKEQIKQLLDSENESV